MKRLVGVILGAALIATGIGAGALTLLQPPAAQQQVFHDLAGNAVTPETEEGMGLASVHQLGDARLAIPSVGLDVPLGEMRTVNGVVNPPGFDAAYVVRDLGTAGGTTFVAMHSLRNGGVGPGNAIFDVNEGRIVLKPGALIEVGGVAYRVTDTAIVPKAQLHEQADVWQDLPGRLVLITCLQNARNSPSTANAVVMAERAAG